LASLRVNLIVAMCADYNVEVAVKKTEKLHQKPVMEMSVSRLAYISNSCFCSEAFFLTLYFFVDRRMKITFHDVQLQAFHFCSLSSFFDVFCCSSITPGHSC
jgi:hypothetical protein